MEDFKVFSDIDNEKFVQTSCYKKLYKMFKGLKSEKGLLLFIVGAPGTGKSVNIIRVIEELDLKIFRINDQIPSLSMNSKEVFSELSKSFKHQLGASSNEEAYKLISEFDGVMVEDFVQYSSKKPLGIWTEISGFKAIPFYFFCIKEYLNHKKEYKKINIIFQNAFGIQYKDKTYYLLTDLGMLSKIALIFFEIFFEIIVISYSEDETIKIVKNYVETNNDVIKSLIEDYGHNPRHICQKLSK